MLLGAHMSIAGGLHNACVQGRDAGCTAIQIFVKNQRQWAASPLTASQAAEFKAAMRECGIRVAFAHDTYLINLASVDDAMHRRSVGAFVDELERCEALGLPYLVTHPGSPGDAGAAAGIRRMRRGLNEALRRTRGGRVRVLLETTAGQGAVLGSSFDEMRAIVDGVRDSDRIGFCFDTCHVFAAGYDLRTPAGWEATMQRFDEVLGTKRILAFHVNDSRKGLGCRVDRHEHIGRGCIGLGAFRCLMRDARFRDVPKVLETDKENDMDRVNLRVLRRLAVVKRGRKSASA